MFKPSTKHNIQAGPSGYAEVKLNGKATGNGQALGRYPYRLNFYTTPPSLDITLEEFETFAINRLRILSYIESLQHRSLPYPQFQTQLAAYLKQYLPLSSNTARSADLVAERRGDEIGHWVLRLAFCRSPDLRARFIRSETNLFKHRFESDDKHEKAEFLQSLQLNWVEVGPDEKRELGEGLRRCLWGREEGFGAETFFKVPWYTVPDLVGSRRVFITNGMAYVPQSLQISLVLQAFSHRLEKALELTAKNLPRLDEDERLSPVLTHLATSFLSGLSASEYETKEGDGTVVTAEMIDDIAKKHFPPCMRHLYERLKGDRHLKHFGRLQLGLFLKGIGLPLDEAIVFWRRMYGATMTDDKFNKEYKYNIRHGYGQEGKRTNYPPKSCQQILTSNQPSTQDSHGCPFRHFSPDSLSSFLISTYPHSFDRSSQELREVMDQVKSTHYHLACTRVFEVVKGVKKGEGLGGENVVHPNKWVDASRAIEKATLDSVKKDEDVEMALVDGAEEYERQALDVV